MAAALRRPADHPPSGRLVLLALAVLGVHLALLSGWPGNTGHDGLAGFGPVHAPERAQAARQDHMDTAPAASAPAPVVRSSVRWLLVPPAPPPPPPAPPKPPRPAPRVQPVAPPAPAQAAPPAPAQTAPGSAEAPAGAVASPPEPAGDGPVPADATLASAAHAQSAGEDTAPVAQAPAGLAVPPASAPVPSAPSVPVAAQAPARAQTAIPAFRTRDLPLATAPASASLVYNVSGQSKGMNYQASGTLDWHHDGLQYQAQMRVSAFILGSRTQRSTGQLDASGLHPDRFTDISRRERETRFDNERERIAYAGHTHQDPLQPGAQDRLSVIIQLAARFNAASPVAGQRLNLQVASASGAERWEFEVVGRETVVVPAGQFVAWHVHRVARHGSDARMSVWLAPSLEHLPVKLVLSQANGDQLEQVLQRLP